MQADEVGKEKKRGKDLLPRVIPELQILPLMSVQRAGGKLRQMLVLFPPVFLVPPLAVFFSRV